MSVSRARVLKLLVLVIVTQVIEDCWAKPTVDVTSLDYTIEKCRKKCIYKFSTNPSKIWTRDGCGDEQDCLMCWDYCEMVPTGFIETPTGPAVAKAMCNDANFCLPGCRFACQHFRIKVRNEFKNLQTNRIR